MRFFIKKISRQFSATIKQVNENTHIVQDMVLLNDCGELIKITDKNISMKPSISTTDFKLRNKTIKVERWVDFNGYSFIKYKHIQVGIKVLEASEDDFYTVKFMELKWTKIDDIDESVIHFLEHLRGKESDSKVTNFFDTLIDRCNKVLYVKHSAKNSEHYNHINSENISVLINSIEQLNKRIEEEGTTSYPRFLMLLFENKATMLLILPNNDKINIMTDSLKMYIQDVNKKYTITFESFISFFIDLDDLSSNKKIGNNIEIDGLNDDITNIIKQSYDLLNTHNECLWLNEVLNSIIITINENILLTSVSQDVENKLIDLFKKLQDNTLLINYAIYIKLKYDNFDKHYEIKNILSEIYSKSDNELIKFACDILFDENEIIESNYNVDKEQIDELLKLPIRKIYKR